MERETGIEPATNSLEGCDSTIELLPLDFVFNNFHCGRLHSFGANGAERRPFAQSLNKAEVPLHKCAKSPPECRYASCREPPFWLASLSKFTTASSVFGSKKCATLPFRAMRTTR